MGGGSAAGSEPCNPGVKAPVGELSPLSRWFSPCESQIPPVVPGTGGRVCGEWSFERRSGRGHVPGALVPSGQGIGYGAPGHGGRGPGPPRAHKIEPQPRAGEETQPLCEFRQGTAVEMGVKEQGAE